MDRDDQRRCLQTEAGRAPADAPHRERKHHQHLPGQCRRTVDRQLGERALPGEDRREHREPAQRPGKPAQPLVRLREGLLRGQPRQYMDRDFQRAEPLQQVDGHLPEPCRRRHSERRAYALLHLVHRERQAGNPVAGHLLRRRQLLQSRVRNLHQLPGGQERERRAEQPYRGTYHRRQERQPVDRHGRRRTELLQPMHAGVQVVPHRARRQQHITEQRESPLLRPRQRNHLDRHPPRRAEQAGHTHGRLHPLPHGGRQPGDPSVEHRPGHSALPRPADHRHTERRMPVQPAGREVPAALQGDERGAEDSHGRRPGDGQGQHAMDCRHG